MTISGVSAAPPVAETKPAGESKAHATAAQAAEKNDTVELSEAAKASASGDVDHDGDSH